MLLFLQSMNITRIGRTDYFLPKGLLHHHMSLSSGQEESTAALFSSNYTSASGFES